MYSAAHAYGSGIRGAVAAGLMLISLIGMTIPVRAADELTEQITRETQRLIEDMDLAEIQQAVPEMDVLQILRDAASGESAMDPDALWKEIRELALHQLKDLLPQMMRIVGVTVFCAGIMRLRSVSDGDGLKKLCETLACITLALPIARDCTSLFLYGRDVTGRMTDFCIAVLPTMLALLTSIGAEKSALIVQELSLAATGTLAQLVQGTLFTLLGCCASLILVSHVAPEIRLQRIIKAMRTCIHWTLGICFTIFLGLLMIQGTTSAHYDGVTMRAAKYAIDKFIPVVGGVFKDTADTLVGCSLVVKNAVGVVGLTGIVLMILQPCVSILCTVGVYKLCAAVMEPLGETRIISALSDFADILTTLFILIISVGAMFFVLLAALMRIGMGVV